MRSVILQIREPGLSFWVASGEMVGMVILNPEGLDGVLSRMDAPHVVVIGRESRLVGTMTLAENLFVLRRNFRLNVIQPLFVEREAGAILREHGFSRNGREPASFLDTSERIYFELLKASMAGARLVVFKDIGKLLLPCGRQRLLDFVKKLASEGTGFLFMDSYPDKLFDPCCRMVLYDGGQTPKTFYSHPMDITPYLESPSLKPLPFTATRPGQDFCFNGTLFTCYPGSCLTILDREGEHLPDLAAEIQRSHESAYNIPENPIPNTLYPNAPYLFNLTFQLDKKLGKNFLPATLMDSVHKEFQEEIGNRYQLASIASLTPSELLDLVYYKALLIRPQLVIIHQPLRGLTMDLQSRLLQLIAKLKERSIAVVILTTRLGPLPAISDEIKKPPVP